jgi:hypothetical protein
MNPKEDMKNEIRSQLAQGNVTLEEYRDDWNGWLDSWLPIYNNEIVQAWQEMPSEYDDRGGQELGTDGTIGIIGLMSLDLYLYYGDLFNQAIEEVEESLDEEVNA